MLPLRHEVGERAGPIAKQWEGEVVGVPETPCALNRKNPDTSPSPRKRGSPPSPRAYDARGEGFRGDESKPRPKPSQGADRPNADGIGIGAL
jgi:hypothetical protein